jgi:hypothetical protein
MRKYRTKTSITEQIEIAKLNLSEQNRLIKQDNSESIVRGAIFQRSCLLEAIRRLALEQDSEPTLEDLKFWVSNTTIEWWQDWLHLQIKRASAHRAVPEAAIKRVRYGYRILNAMRHWVQESNPSPQIPQIPQRPAWAAQREKPKPHCRR